MHLVQVAHQMATDATFAAQMHLLARTAHANIPSTINPSELVAVLRLVRRDNTWQRLCNPALSEQPQIGWCAPTSNIALQGIRSLWNEANIAPDYRSAMDTALPRQRAEQGMGAAHPTLADLPQLSYDAAGGQHSIKSLTEAWNLLYAALHLLDNIEDGDAPGTWGRWGTGPAINIATGLLASANLALARLEQHGVSAAAAQHIREQLNHTLVQMCSGQHADLTCHAPSLEQCWNICEAKSGIFFALACEAGARATDANQGTVVLFRQFGLHLGMLIQIGDDLSGIWPTATAASDLLAQHRWTLPVAYAMSVLPPARRQQLRTALEHAPFDQQAEAEARRIVVGAGAVLYLAIEAERHSYEAEQALLRAACESPARTTLLALLHQLLPTSSVQETMFQVPVAAHEQVVAA